MLGALRSCEEELPSDLARAWMAHCIADTERCHTLKRTIRIIDGIGFEAEVTCRKGLGPITYERDFEDIERLCALELKLLRKKG